jgi:hypothetical protein
VFEVCKTDGTGGAMINPHHIVAIEWEHGGDLVKITLVTGRVVECDDDIGWIVTKVDGVLDARGAA